MTIRLIINILILAGALIFGFTLTWPEYKDFRKMRLEFKQKNAELDYKKDYYFKIRDIWQGLERYDDVLAKIDSAIPSSYSLPAIFNHLKQTAGETGLILTDLNFGGVSGETIKEISINIKASGDYRSFKNFLSALESSGRIFEIKSISFSYSKDGAFSFSLGLSTYSY